MDLRSVLNDNGGDRERATSKTGGPPPQPRPAATPQLQHQQSQHGQHAAPPNQNPHSQQPSPSVYGAYSPRQQQQQQPPPPPPQHYDHPHSSPGKPPPSVEYAQQQQQQQQQQQRAAPIAHHHTHQQSPHNVYPPQSPYQTPGPYQSRPAPPPPLQATNSFHDSRSPSGPPTQAHAPPPSPYRPTPTPTSAKSQSQGGYPFPPTQASPQEITSPSQRQQYQTRPQPRQDSYNQPAPSHVQGQYASHAHVPQTPPIATSGVPQQYPLKQSQSQSVHSTPTPTSAHSQHHYGQPFAHGSPVSSTHAGVTEFNRQPSQPPTPLGHPPAQRRESQTYAQPPSPYQARHYSQQMQASPTQQSQPQASPQQSQQTQPPLQLYNRAGPRPSSAKGFPSPPSNFNNSIFQNQTTNQTQPQPQPQPQIQPQSDSALQQQQQVSQIQPQKQPLPQSESALQQQQVSQIQYLQESQIQDKQASQIKQQPQIQQQQPPPLSAHTSHHEREHSVSVSPQTRVPSLPSNADRSSFSREAPEVIAAVPQQPQQPQQQQPQLPRPSLAQSQPTTALTMANDGTTTPLKRKLEDRDLSLKELEHNVPRPPPGAVNGRTPSDRDETMTQDGDVRMAQTSEVVRRKSKRYSQRPLWARDCSILGDNLPKKDNFVLRKRAPPAPQSNGSVSAKPRGSIHPSPQASRAQVPPPPLEPTTDDMLGPWEPSIVNVKPLEELAKSISDFLFVQVMCHPDRGEIANRGIQFEIEAKLGVLIDKDTNTRVHRGVDSECILTDSGRTAFKNGLSETYHQSFNKWLNKLVEESDPRRKANSGRVPIQYKHRREVDRFVDLPPDFQHRLPACMQPQQGARRRMKARLTYDQKTNQVLAKIVKTRVADLDWHMPKCPIDCRLSINLEMDWDGDVRELEALLQAQQDRQPDRIKDRLSYKHGHYQIDLTQVQSAGHGANARADKEHELEIELSPAALLNQGQRVMDGEPNKYPELVEGFLDNVRVLARKAHELRQEGH